MFQRQKCPNCNNLMESNGYRYYKGIKQNQIFVCRKCKIEKKQNNLDLTGLSPCSKKAILQRCKTKYFGWKIKFYIYDFLTHKLKTVYPKKYFSELFLNNCASVEDLVAEYYLVNNCKVDKLFNRANHFTEKGVPDLCVKYKRRQFFVEVKSEQDSLKVRQLLFLSIHKGCIIWVCKGGRATNLTKIKQFATRNIAFLGEK